MRRLAIYIHVPFCVRKCAYCDFASFAGCEGRIDAYFDALWREIDAWREELADRMICSVFFGGGTPSLVPAEKIVRTLDLLRGASAFAPDAEVSIEANPGTLTQEKLHAYRRAGVNRISIGVQSLQAQELKALGRIHTPEEALEAVSLARQAGFENISIDLMYALPGQSLETWEDTLRRAIALPVTHISAYSLIIEPGTEMARRAEAGEFIPIDDDTVNEMQRACIQILSEAGLERYEISNYARSGYACRHNIAYWTDGEYLGLGSAAHSLMDNMRFSNPPELERYIAGERMLDASVRTAEDRREERLMLETRLVRGLDLTAWRADFGEAFHSRSIPKLEALGMIEIQDDHLRLTMKGLELQDAVVAELLDV